MTDWSLCCPPLILAGWERNRILATRPPFPMALTKSGNPCSWCLTAHGVAATPGDSHGICQRHYDEMAARVAARKGAR